MNRFLLSAASAVVATMIASGASANTLYFQMNPNELSGPRQAFIFGAPNSTGTVIGSGGFSQDFNLGAQGFATIDVPIAQQLAAGVVENKGFRITSDASLSAYFLSRAPATTDMSYLIDGARLGTDHVVAGYRNIRPDQISVQATVDNTTVTFTPVGGAAFDVTLNAGQTYMYAASAELTGSRVTSNNPIAVFSGNQCSNIPSNNTACDHIVEQMPATNLLSTNYLVAQTPRTGSGGNVLRVVATENATEVRVNGALVATLDSGQFYEGRVVGGQEIEATKKVLVAQYLIGTTQAGAVTDPAMTIVPGSDQWLSSYVFAAPSGTADFPDDAISIIMRTSDIGTLTIDGILADPTAFNALASTAFSFGNFDVSGKSGPFSISAASPFQLLLSGFASADSYFTYGGAAFSPGASPPPDEPPPPPPSESVFWDGSNPANADNGIVDGGDGVWDVSDTTFTLSDGATNNAYPEVPPTVVFAGAAGTVTVDNSLGQVQSSGMTFSTDGYVIKGDPIELILGTGGDGGDGEGGGDGDGGDGDGEGGGDGDGELMLSLLSLTPTAVAITTDEDVTATIESDLFGDVDVDKLGLGTLVLSGDNSFLNFRISEGVAAIGSNTGAGSGTITIANDATLAAGGPGVVLDNPVITEGNGLVDAGPAGNVFTLDGDISGPGSISQVGLGNLVLNGDNSYTNLGINAGTVTFGTNTAGGIGAIAINNNATLAAGVSGLVVDNDIQTTGAGTINSGAGVFTLTGVIGNVGSITKTGSGKLILTGTNSYSGTTTVAAGNLSVQGNNGTSVVTVKSGATLSGTGTVGTTNVERGGIVSPGNSIGTLVVNGDLNQAAGSIYAVELGTPPNGDRIVVGGSANISAGAIVNVTNTTGSRYVLGSEWAIVQTGVARNGVYTLTGDTRVSQFIDVIGRYDAKNAYLRVAQTSSFASAGDTINQINSATGSDATGNGSLYSAIAYLPNEAAAQDAFDQTSGELHASIRGESFEDSRFVREAIYNHTAQAVEPRIGMWVAGFGSWGTIDSDGNAAEVDRSIGGFFLGLDALKSESASLGVLTGYSTADINVPDRNSYASTDDLYVGLYGSYDVSGFNLTAAVTNTWRWVGTRRSIAFEGFQDSVRANYLINVFQAFGEGSYDFRIDKLGIQPFASFAYVSVKADDFAEFGGPASLSADDNVSDDFWTTLLGIRLNYGLPINGDTFSLSASGGWRYVFEGDVFTPSTMRFYSGPAFEVYGAPVAQNAFAASFTIQTKLTDRADMDIGYSGQYGDGFNDSGVRASLRLRF